MAFVDNLAGLASADHIAAIELTGPDGAIETIANAPGSQGSVRVYQHLALKFGGIGPEAAAEGLALYAEHTEDARRNPGKHPNIDRLFSIRTGTDRLAVRLITKP